VILLRRSTTRYVSLNRSTMGPARPFALRNCPKSLVEVCGVALRTVEMAEEESFKLRMVANFTVERCSKHFSDSFLQRFALSLTHAFPQCIYLAKKASCASFTVPIVMFGQLFVADLASPQSSG
jgi:hypothetical protein